MRMYEFALDVEQAGQEFYQQMSDSVRDPGVQRIFAMMAADEQRLMSRVSALRQQVARRGLADVDMFAREDNVYRRLQPERLRVEVRDDLDAYHLILELVEEVCQVYERRAEEVGDPELRRALQEILACEREELEELLLLYDFANAPNESLAWGEFSNLGEYPRFGHEPLHEREWVH